MSETLQPKIANSHKVFCELNILRYLPEDVKQQFINELYPFIEKINSMSDLPEGDFIAVCKADFPPTEEVINALKDTAYIFDDPSYYFEITEIINTNKGSLPKI